MKIDDSIYLNQMELEYSNINEFHSKLEQKAYTMIGIIGVVMSIESSIILSLNFKVEMLFLVNSNSLLFLIFLSSIISFLISMFLFLFSLKDNNFKIMPNSDSIIDYYEYDYDEIEFYQTMLGDYQVSIKNNLNLVRKKYIYTYYGFIPFEIGIIFLIIFIIGYIMV